MTTMYSVFHNSSPGELIMTAPMSTIQVVFRLHRDAVRRVTQELDAGEPVSVVHFNGKTVAMNLDAIIVAKAQ
jgi:hypothetical protein